MSLLDIANSIKQEGFDPRKDSVNGNAQIPAGTYPAVLKSAEFNISEKGWESLLFVFEVRGGDFDGRQEFVRFGTLDSWNGKDLGWSVKRTLKFWQKAIVLAGDEAFKKDFEDGKSLEEALQRKAVGSYYNLTITVSENKKDPANPYRNYDINEVPNAFSGGVEISDDDLPF